jgi:hypothetical protein
MLLAIPLGASCVGSCADFRANVNRELIWLKGENLKKSG